MLYRDWRAAVIGEHAGARVGRDTFPIWSRNSTQIGPSVSPDGARAVFFSEHDRLSLDLFLADVRTGLVIRKLATTAASAKFDSLQPLRSAGAWSPDGRWFAFAAVRQGRAAIQLVDVGQGTGDREMRVSERGPGAVADVVARRAVDRVRGDCRRVDRSLCDGGGERLASPAHR